MASVVTQYRTVTCGFCQRQGHNRRTCPVRSDLQRNVTIRPKKKEKKITQLKKEFESDDHDCSICFEDCKKKGCELECGHKFHSKCIFKWFSGGHNTCPMCRSEVNEMYNKPPTPRIRLPPIEAWGAFERILSELIDVEGLNKSEYSQAMYMLVKSRLESLSGEEYEEFLSLSHNV